MIGKIIGIEENTVLIKLTLDLDKFQSLISLHVVMEQGDTKIVGEIVDIKDGIAFVNLLGEIKDEKFMFGVIKKPSFGSVIKLISKVIK